MTNTRQISIPRNHIVARKNYAQYSVTRQYRLALILILVHIPLGYFLYRSSTLALIHPVGVTLLGLYFAIRKDQPIERVAYVIAYIVGAEVLWRMARADIFWESGKYAASLIMIVALVRRHHWKPPTWPVIFFVFLIPASLYTIFSEGLWEGKDKLSFNMSGPFLLFISCWFFSWVQISRAKLKNLLLLIAIPIISVALISLFYTVTIEDIQFSNNSNNLTSGGFGANQVSSVLGLGVFVCLAAYLLCVNNFVDKVFIAIAALMFAGQSVLTFSRGGMYNALGAILAVVVFQFADWRNSIKRLVPVFALAVFFLVLGFPYLDDFTGGALETRFENTGTTGRLEIVEADLEIFLANPILGAGVGEAPAMREEAFGRAVGAHTEFTRIIAEHGLLGIFALISLVIGAVVRLQKKQPTLSRSMAIGAIVWSSLFMTNAGMRLAAPSFMWGLSFMSVVAGVPPGGKRSGRQRNIGKSISTDITDPSTQS